MTLALPNMGLIKRTFSDPFLQDVAGSVRQSFQRDLTCLIKPNQRIGVAVGSRGITDLAVIVSEVVSAIRACDATPVIIPAMGSHGGATPEGQMAILASLGVQPSSLNAEWDSSMETTIVGNLDDEIPMHFSTTAMQCDGVVLVNRIKPHTRLVGSIQSGLIKMAVVGLGKHEGAASMHRLFGKACYRWDEVAKKTLAQVISKTNIMGGFAIIEQQQKKVSHVEWIDVEHFLHREKNLLDMASNQLARLPFDALDLLIVDRIGKDISGTGMDAVVVGRKSHDQRSLAGETPNIDHIHVRSLTDATSGNATGIGLAQSCLSDLVNKIDREKTLVNCQTSDHESAALVHRVYLNDREMLEALLTKISRQVDEHRWAAIASTGELEHIWCSEALAGEIDASPHYEWRTEPAAIHFDDANNLVFDFN